MNKLGLMLALVAATAVATSVPAAGPYAGEERRDIASLSPADVAELLAGGGWGFARPAELSGYPGPRHVLDLGRELDLDERQRTAVAAVFERMNAEARRLGADYVEAERAVDQVFRTGRVDGKVLALRLAEAGRLRDQLRRIHLAAHLETAPILTAEQRRLYQRLRGHGAGADAGHGHGQAQPGAGHR